MIKQKWSSFGDLVNSRKGAATIVIDNNLYIFGGRNDDGSIVKLIEKKSLTATAEFNFVNIEGNQHIHRNRFVAYPLNGLTG